MAKRAYPKKNSEYKSYAEKLRDPRWQEKRLLIMQRDNFSCQMCYNKELTLNVHHRFYLKGKDPWDYQDNCFITLCEDCHLLIEQKSDIVKTSLNAPSEDFDAIFQRVVDYKNPNDPLMRKRIYSCFDEMMRIAALFASADAAGLDKGISSLQDCILDMQCELSLLRELAKKHRINHPDFIPPWKRTK